MVNLKLPAFSLVCFLTSFSIQKGEKGRNKIPFIDIPSCKNNTLFYSERDTTENHLPVDFYAPAACEGHLGIGGEHARPFEKRLDPIWVWVPEGRIDIGIRFAQELEFLSKNTERKALGFSFDFTIDGKSYKKTFRKVVNTIADMFNEEGKKDDNYNEEVLKTSFFRWNENTINLRIDLNGNNRFYLNSVDFYYGDLPKKVAKVYLLPKNENSRYDIEYNKDECHLYDDEYSLNVGTKAEFSLSSPYGSFFGRDYLEDCFGVRKSRNDDFVIHDNNIVSEGGSDYFYAGHLAPIGTEYTITLKSSYRRYDEKIILHLTVSDKKPPSFYFPAGKSIQRSYKSDFASSRSYENSGVLISDNKDDILQRRLRQKDGSPIPEKTCGEFACLLQAWDRAGNLREEEVSATLVDDIPPSLEREYSDLFLPKDNQKSKKELLSLFTARDEIDARPLLSIKEDTYSTRWNQPGNYRFTVLAKDKDGNEGEKTRNIHVLESFGEYYRKEGFLKAREGNVPTREEVVSLFIQSGQIEDKSYSSITQIEGERLSKERKAGVYPRKIKLFQSDGKESVFPFTLEVLKNEERPLEGEKESLWQKIASFFTRIFSAIASFFQNLFGR